MCLTMHRHDQQLRHRASGKSVSASRAGCDARATHLLGLYSRLFTSCPSSSLRSDIKDTNRMLAHGRPPTRKTCSLPRAHVNRRVRSAGRIMGWVKIAWAGAGGGGARTNTQEDQPTGALSTYTICASEWAAASALAAWGVQACSLCGAVTRDARAGGAGR